MLLIFSAHTYIFTVHVMEFTLPSGEAGEIYFRQTHDFSQFLEKSQVQLTKYFPIARFP